MFKAISNTSPLLYLYRIGAIDVLPLLFEECWTPKAVEDELLIGQACGHDVPVLSTYPWLVILSPRFAPSEWLASDLGAGEIAAMSLALEYPERVVLLDDALARRTAQAAGLNVWGTLRVLLEAKKQGFITKVEPFVEQLQKAGMWLSVEIKHRILALAGER